MPDADRASVADAAPPGAVQANRLPPLVVAGYILAVVMPLAGLIVGVVLLTRPPKSMMKQGMWIIAVSVVIGFVFFVALILYSHSSGAATEGGE
jgi:hypothetical protein